MAQTALQNQQQDEQAAAGYDAVIPAQIDTGSTVPPFYQTNHVAAEMAKNPQITPPTTGEIHKQMWVSSMMMGLMTALATGNVAGGLVGGMWAAIGVHDYGYSLRQRSEYIDRLKGDGYSMPAILKWYEDGDSKELDKERQDMLQRDRMTQQDREFNQRLDQQDRQFNQREALQQAEFGQRMAMEGARLGAMERHQQVMEGIAAQRAQGSTIAEKRLLQSQIRDTIKGAQQKQYYMQMAAKAMDQLKTYKQSGNRAGAAEAYHNVRNALARASLGGNATLTADQIEQSTGLPAWFDKKANELGITSNGMPSDMFIDSTDQQIKDDLHNEQQTILEQGQQFHSSLVGQGYSNDDANELVNGAMTGTAIGARDWSKKDDTPPPSKDDNSDHSTTPETVNWSDLK